MDIMELPEDERSRLAEQVVEDAQRRLAAACADNVLVEEALAELERVRGEVEASLARIQAQAVTDKAHLAALRVGRCPHCRGRL